MELIAEILSWILLIAGSALCMIGALGLLRLPDVFTRMHGAGIIDTGGAGLILAGLMIQGGLTFVTIKLFLVILFILFSSPAATHALARAALNDGAKPFESDKTKTEPKTAGDGEPSKT
ncbi:MAG: monovalent cation/H(+) antiporter subunit G [Rhodospirillales bacterium]|nr:monovalent cation/H(+) antiporter subunit G [Rhodospirillales bacterium]